MLGKRIANELKATNGAAVVLPASQDLRFQIEDAHVAEALPGRPQAAQRRAVVPLEILGESELLPRVSILGSQPQRGLESLRGFRKRPLLEQRIAPLLQHPRAELRPEQDGRRAQQHDGRQREANGGPPRPPPALPPLRGPGPESGGGAQEEEEGEGGEAG